MKKVFWIFIGSLYNTTFVDPIDKNTSKHIKSPLF